MEIIQLIVMTLIVGFVAYNAYKALKRESKYYGLE